MDKNDPANDFELPVFDRLTVEPPSGMAYGQVVDALEEVIKAFRLREVPREPEAIPEFRMD